MTTEFVDPVDPVPGTDDASEMAVQRALCAAERLLSSRLGARVQLADPECLGGSGRSTVVRVRVARTPFTLPRTLVVKHHGAPAAADEVDPFALEAASCQLFTALWHEGPGHGGPGHGDLGHGDLGHGDPAQGDLGHEDLRHEARLGPELIACDSMQRLLVLEDLGRSGTVASQLHSADGSRAERALLSWAHALGRLHATSRHCETDFSALLRRLGATWIRDPIAAHCQAAVAGLPALLETELGVVSPPDAVAEVRRAAEVLEGHLHRAFSPADLGPDNAVVVGKTVRFIDFDSGGFRTALLATAQLRAPLPSSGVAFAFPPGMAEAMVSAWHAEVVGSWPELADRSVLARRLLEGQLLWTWLCTWCWLGPQAAVADHGALLVDHWERLTVDADRVGYPATTELALTVAEALRRRFRIVGEALPWYPAFR